MTDLARQAGVSAASVNNWENHGASPRPDKVASLAEHFGVTEAYLTHGVREVEYQSLDDIIEEAKAKIAKSLRVPKSRFEIELRFKK